MSLDWPDLPRVPARLEPLGRELSAIWWEQHCDRLRWSLELQEWCHFVAGGPPADEDEQVARRLQPGLPGPSWFHLVPHRAFAVVGHVARWKQFLGDSDERDRLRRSCKLIGRPLGATRVA